MKNLTKPINMVLPCPVCHMLHVDRPNPHTGWTNPPHRSHKCAGCGTIWRPADVLTNGVLRIATMGKNDTWPPSKTHYKPNFKDDNDGLDPSY